MMLMLLWVSVTEACFEAFRRECSWARSPPKRMKIGLRKVWSAITPNFVISTGVFMGPQPTQEDENRVEKGLVGDYT